MSVNPVSRRVLYCPDGSEVVDHSYFGDVNVGELFPSVNVGSGIDLQCVGDGSSHTVSIPGNLKTLCLDEVDSDRYLLMLIGSTKHSDEVQHRNPSQMTDNNVHVDVTPVDTHGLTSPPQTDSKSTRSNRSTGSNPHGNTVRIQVIKQNVSLWGDYQIDRFGRIISDSLVHEEKCADTTEESTNTTKISRELTEKRLISLKERDMSREGKWVDMLDEWEKTQNKKSAQLKKRLRKGIPNSMRSLVWHRQLDTRTERQKHDHSYYYDLLRQEIQPQDDTQIRKDQPRLKQHYALFKSPIAGSRDAQCQGQASSYNVQKAYSQHDKRVGYVQGMDSLVSVILQYYPEEVAFWCLERLMNDPCFQLRDLYIEGMPKAFLYLYTHTAQMRKYVPALSKVCEEHHINPISYAFRWYTLRFSHFHPELALRVMDVFLYEHDKVQYRVAMAILKYYEKTLVRLAQTSPEEIISFLGNLEQRNDFVNTDQIDALMEQAMDISMSRVELAKLYDKWAAETRERMM